MPRQPVTASLVLQQATQFNQLDVTPERAAEIAPEVEALNRATLEAAPALDLNDEPGQFPLALARNRQPRGSIR